MTFLKYFWYCIVKEPVFQDSQNGVIGGSANKSYWTEPLEVLQILILFVFAVIVYFLQLFGLQIKHRCIPALSSPSCK